MTQRNLDSTPDETHTNRLLAVIAADRDHFAPPPGLAARTLGRLAEVLVAEGRFDSESQTIRNEPVAVPSEVAARRPVSDGPVFFAWARADLIVMALLVMLVVSLGLPLIQKVRARADMVACREQLRGLHTGLQGYADTHDGRIPQVGTSDLPTAGGFMAELVRSGQADPRRPVGCGRLDGDPDPGYAYTLGYLTPGGHLTGVRLGEVTDFTPIAADLPRYEENGVSGRHGGWNVLMASGSVSFVTSVNVGLDGDDIFRNGEGFHRAGLNSNDISLGRPFDRP